MVWRHSSSLLHFSADGSNNHHPLIISKSEKQHCLKGLGHYPSDWKSPKNAWVTGRLFRERLLTFERKTASHNMNELLLTDQSVAFNSEGTCSKTCAPLVSTTKHHQSHATNGTEASHPVWNVLVRCRNDPAKTKENEYLGCHARCICGTEIHYACSNPEPLCIIWLCHLFQSMWTKMTKSVNG